MRRTLGFGAAALVMVLAAVLVMAPAQWLAAALRNATNGHLELADARGTIWSGRAVLVLTGGNDTTTPRASLPEPFSWRLAPLPLLAGVAEITLEHPTALQQALTIRASRGGRMQAGPGLVRMPAAPLTGLGAPWNTIRPGGVIVLSWDRLTVEPGRITGDVSAEWQLASSALTPVSPFGHYRLQTNGVYPGTRLNLLTLSGPLELTGNGTIAEGGQLRFQGVARAMPGVAPTVKAQLSGLIALLGRRDDDAAILSFGK